MIKAPPPAEYRLIQRFLSIDNPHKQGRDKEMRAILDEYDEDVAKKAAALLKAQYPAAEGATLPEIFQEVYVALHNAAPFQPTVRETDTNLTDGDTSNLLKDDLLLEDVKTYDRVLIERMAHKAVSLPLMETLLREGEAYTDHPPHAAYPKPHIARAVPNTKISQQDLTRLLTAEAAPGPNLCLSLIEIFEMPEGTKNFFLASVNDAIRKDKPVLDIEQPIHVDMFQKSVSKWRQVVKARSEIVEAFNAITGEEFTPYTLAERLHVSQQVMLGIRKPSILEDIVKAARKAGIPLDEQQARHINSLQEKLTGCVGIAPLRSAAAWTVASPHIMKTYHVNNDRAQKLIITMRKGLVEKARAGFLAAGKDAFNSEVEAEAKVDFELLGMGGFGRHVKPGICISEAGRDILEREYVPLPRNNKVSKDPRTIGESAARG